ncbi:N-acetylglucosamine-6-phosphate deacetylase [Niastella yeongjuensis]|uniref:N-acetylglucosamine-6-phosphate deacetylase n=1 Tax=Niastella yeongjuensis TaxID=354355 RepID=A0A1V9E9F3_9BACT|nr:N-acetylglucosamine-6-phosphate deacetylase [Niastella yeongjuensis]OQP42729.1 N-acetylglucosamine-6-phosphate deacetylase [Niastella yeongjuensis]SEO51612.1 N-acetylglucosamine-6-phosphate deacetylase [Niastella yeongjuensis]
MNERPLKICHANIITPHRIIPNGCLLIQGTSIAAVAAHDIEITDADIIDAAGKYVAPGFIDIHVHGGGGFDFMDATEEAFLAIAETHARYGTTALSPTTLTGTQQHLLHTLEVYEQANKNNHKGASFIGMHLEGPYFSINQRGAQDPRYIRNPDPKEYMDVVSRSTAVKRWSAAPELPGAIAFGQYLRAHNILVSLAHTDAIYEEVLEAYENGYTLATHLYSSMLGVTRRNAIRYAGAVEAAFLLDGMDVEIIADGIHLPAPLLKLVYKIKGADKTALITDAMRAAGTNHTESVLGHPETGLKVIIEDGVAKLPDRSSFAGSIATADQLVRNMITLADVPLADAVKMMSLTPATIMGIANKKGLLAPGKDADIVIFDKDITIHNTIIMGNPVYNRPAGIA